MKAFIFDPLWDKLITDDLQNQLKSNDLELVVTMQSAPLSENKALLEGDDERILCINPDYVGWKVSSEDYSNIPNLKGILSSVTSFSWIDMTYANEMNIPVCNIRSFSTQAVAEWAILMMLNIARQVPRLIKDGFPLDFDKDFMKYRGMELKNKTVGIIGLGNNGTAIAERCHGLGMNVTYWSRASRDEKYSFVELDKLFTESDIIVFAFAKNNETLEIVTKERLMSAKSSTIVIDIIELEDIRDTVLGMVEQGKLFGYGFESKPRTFNDYTGNVWAAPAYAWVTDASMNNTMTKWIENMIEASKNNYPNRVNK